MCTAVTYQTEDFYFGRTLDNACSYGEEIVILPRNAPFPFRRVRAEASHHAIIGMAYVADGVPLYYDAVNEKGLAMAGLNFVGNAVYHDPAAGKDNLAQFELIAWILGRCASVREARALLAGVNITNDAFRADLPPAPLHWLIADRTEAITVESVADGLRTYDNPVGVLTNNPPFDMQLFQLNNYMRLSPKTPQNGFSERLDLQTYSLGMGALGLPGDLSSSSRFVRAAFTKLNAKSGKTEAESVNQFFHILGSVEQQMGCCEVPSGGYEYTVYTSCCNATRGIYYYTTYGNHRITAVDLRAEAPDGARPVRYPLLQGESILRQNGAPDVGREGAASQ